MSTPESKKPWRFRFRWKRWLVGILISVLIAAVSIFAKEIVKRWQAWGDLQRIIAELDENDPHWRLEDIEAHREEIPPEMNSAFIIIEAAKLLPKDWEPKTLEELEKLPRNVGLSEDQADRLAAELMPFEPVLEKARHLKDYPKGRFKNQYTADYFSTMLYDQQGARRLASLLALDVIFQSHLKEHEKAWRSLRAQFNAGRSLDDDPSLVAMNVRRVIGKRSARTLERVLAQGEITADRLEEVRAICQEECDFPRLVIGIRGESACTHQMLTKVENEELTLQQAFKGFPPELRKLPAAWSGVLGEFFAYSMILRSHADLLVWETNAVGSAKLPSDLRFRALFETQDAFLNQARGDKSKAVAFALFPHIRRHSEWNQWLQAYLSCAITALAVEQFRLREGGWPESLDQLVQRKLLKEIPFDLHHGRPMGYRRDADGVVIYSTGIDGDYEGMGLDRRGLPFKDDSPDHFRPAEFRLWEPALRGVP